MVKGGDWTTFDVVFLARVVGAVQNTLYIHTSMGTFDYKVCTYTDSRSIGCTYYIDAEVMRFILHGKVWPRLNFPAEDKSHNLRVDVHVYSRSGFYHRHNLQVKLIAGWFDYVIIAEDNRFILRGTSKDRPCTVVERKHKVKEERNPRTVWLVLYGCLKLIFVP